MCCVHNFILLLQEKPDSRISVNSFSPAMIRLYSRAEADQAQNVDTKVSATSAIRDFIKTSMQPLKNLLFS